MKDKYGVYKIQRKKRSRRNSNENKKSNVLKGKTLISKI